MAREHGKAKTPIYNAWLGMRARCYNKNNAAYANYGGRGIFVCERWLSFENFYADMGDPLEGMSIDRIDNDGPYSPDNCRWADRATQSRNRRNAFAITIDGVTKSAVEWSETSGIKGATIRNRIRKGWGAREAVFNPTVLKREGIARGLKIHLHQGRSSEQSLQ